MEFKHFTGISDVLNQSSSYFYSRIYRIIVVSLVFFLHKSSEVAIKIVWLACCLPNHHVVFLLF